MSQERLTLRKIFRPNRVIAIEQSYKLLRQYRFLDTFLRGLFLVTICLKNWTFIRNAPLYSTNHTWKDLIGINHRTYP